MRLSVFLGHNGFWISCVWIYSSISCFSGNSQWQQFRVIGLYQTDFRLELFSPVPEKISRSPPPHPFIWFSSPSFYGGKKKKSILLFYLKRQKCTYECEEEKERGRAGSFTETPHDRRAFNPLSRAGRWIKYGANCTNVFAEFAAPRKRLFLDLL